MRRPTPLPPGLASGPFLVRDGLAAGVGAKRMRGRDLSRPTRGVRLAAAPPVTELETLARAVLLALPPGLALSHPTAATVLRLPLPLELATLPLHVMGPTARGRVRRPGVEGHRGLEHRTTTVVRGLPVTGLVDTWADLAEMVQGDDLVVLGDAVAWRTRDLDALATAVEARAGGRGVRALRAALPQVRVGARSPQETRARLLFTRAGLPEPELNADLFVDGFWIACHDFLWRREKVVGEYQGAPHFGDFARGDDDITRRREAEDHGHAFVDFTKRDLAHPPRRRDLVLRLGRLLDVEPDFSPGWDRGFPGAAPN